jgi:hypothetical protein
MAQRLPATKMLNTVLEQLTKVVTSTAAVRR